MHVRLQTETVQRRILKQKAGRPAGRAATAMMGCVVLQRVCRKQDLEAVSAATQTQEVCHQRARCQTEATETGNHRKVTGCCLRCLRLRETSNGGALVIAPTDFAISQRSLCDMTLEDVKPLTVTGYQIHSPLAAFVCKRVQGMLECPAEVDLDKVQQCLAFRQETRAITMHALASDLYVRSDMLRNCLSRFTMTWCCCVLSKRLELERRLALLAQQGLLVHFVEHFRMGETPMRLRTKECFHALTREDNKHLASGENVAAVTGETRLPLDLMRHSNTGTKRLLQPDQGWGALLKTRGGSLVIVMQSWPSPLMLLENESRPVLTEAAIRLCGTSRHLHGVKQKSRIVTEDGHPSNRKAGSNLAGIRPGWPRWWIWCVLHLVAPICRDALLSLRREVSRGILYTALVVSHGTAMETFRRRLLDEVVASLDMQWGVSPPSAKAHRGAMIDLFAGTAGKASSALIRLLPNGDWRKKKVVEWYPHVLGTRCVIDSTKTTSRRSSPPA